MSKASKIIDTIKFYETKYHRMAVIAKQKRDKAITKEDYNAYHMQYIDYQSKALLIEELYDEVTDI